MSDEMTMVLPRDAAKVAASAEFQPFRPGVEIATVYLDEANGAHCALLRYAPGAAVPEHRHEGYEHIFVLEGEQQDERGCYAAGTLIVNPPGSRHQVSSPKGCLVLILWQRPVAFVNASE